MNFVPKYRKVLHRRGQSTVEFALIMPVFLFLMMGIIDYARYYFLEQSMSNILRGAGRFAATGKTLTVPDPKDASKEIQLDRRASILEYARQENKGILDIIATDDEEKAGDNLKLDPENGGNGGDFLTLKIEQDIAFITPFISKHVFDGKIETQLRIVNERFD